MHLVLWRVKIENHAYVRMVVSNCHRSYATWVPGQPTRWSVSVRVRWRTALLLYAMALPAIFYSLLDANHIWG